MENSSFQLLFRQLEYWENESELETKRNSNVNPEVTGEELTGNNLSYDNPLAGDDGLSGEDVLSDDGVSCNVEGSIGDPSKTDGIGDSYDIVQSDANSSFEEIPNNFEGTNERLRRRTLEQRLNSTPITMPNTPTPDFIHFQNMSSQSSSDLYNSENICYGESEG